MTQKLYETFRMDTKIDVTFVNSENGRFKEDILDKLNSQGVIGVVKGPTKIGKTVLVRKMLADSKIGYVNIQGSDLNDDSLEDLLKKKLSYEETEIVNEFQSSNEIGYKVQGSATVSSGFSAFFIKVKAKLNAKSWFSGRDTKKTLHKTLQKGVDVFEQLVQRMITEDIVLLIDDFYYLDEEKQLHVLRQLQEPVGEGLKVLILLIPSRSDLVSHLEPDLAGRLNFISIPNWTTSELQMIPAKGFSALGYPVDEQTLTYIGDYSFGSPALSQNLSLIVGKKLLADTNLTGDTIDWGSIFQEVVSKQSSLLRALREGATTRGTRRAHFKTKMGDTRDLYELILLTIGGGLMDSKPTSKQIRTEVIELLFEGEKRPTTQQIEQTLDNLAEVAKKSSYYEAVIVFDGFPKTLKVSDSMFKLTLKLFRMEWEEANE